MITALLGTNHFLLKQRLTELTEQFLSQYGGFALERIDCEEVELRTILEAVQSVPFLTPKKMIVLRNLSANKLASEAINYILEDIPDFTEIIIYEPYIDKRSIYFKSIKKHKEVTLIEFGDRDRPELAKWLSDEAEKAGGKLSVSDANYLIDRVGTDQMLLYNELQKLTTYNKHISQENIELLTEPEPQSRIFDLLDAAFSGHAERAMKLYEEQRTQKVEPQQILALLAWQLHIVAIVLAAGQRSVEDISSEAKLNPFVVRKAKNLARKISSSKVKELIAEALDIDVSGKTTAINLDDALKNYLLSITRL